MPSYCMPSYMPPPPSSTPHPWVRHTQRGGERGTKGEEGDLHREGERLSCSRDVCGSFARSTRPHSEVMAHVMRCDVNVVQAACSTASPTTCRPSTRRYHHSPHRPHRPHHATPAPLPCLCALSVCDACPSVLCSMIDLPSPLFCVVLCVGDAACGAVPGHGAAAGGGHGHHLHRPPTNDHTHGTTPQTHRHTPPSQAGTSHAHI